MRKSKPLGFLIIFAIYAVTTVGGIFLFNALEGNLWLKLLIVEVATTTFVYIFSVLLNTASVYDPFWSVQPIVIGIAYAWGKDLSVAQILPLVIVCIWGVRLTANWAYTFTGMQYQDWRYTMLKEKTGPFYQIINYIGIHMVPSLVVYLCVLPLVYVMDYAVTANVGTYFGAVVMLGATILEAVADIQMQNYRKTRPTPFIRVGLWKYSRHPNYLGEISMWWGLAICVVSVLPSMWYLFAGAFVNTMLFCFVSLPMAETRQSRKEGWAEYKKQTRLLLPFKK